MWKLLGSKFIYLIIVVIFGCKPNMVLPSTEEREKYKNCSHLDIPKILAEHQGIWNVESIDSTSSFYVFYLCSITNDKRIIGVSEKAKCQKNEVEKGRKYFFRFSCDISTKGNYSLYIFKPENLFVGHNFMVRVPLGTKEEYINIQAQSGIIVLKISNMEGL